MKRTDDEQRDEDLESFWHVAAAEDGIKQVLGKRDRADGDRCGPPDAKIGVETQEREQVAVRHPDLTLNNLND